MQKVNFLGFSRFSWFCLRRGLIFQDQVHRNMQSAKSSTFSKNTFLENHRKTRFTISKYLVLKNEPSEVKKSGKSRKVEKSTFCDFAGPRRDLSMEVLKNEASRGPKAPKAQKVAYLRYCTPPAPLGYLGAAPRLPRRAAAGANGCSAAPVAPRTAAWRTTLPLATSVRRPLRCARVCPWLARCGGRCAARESAPG